MAKKKCFVISPIGDENTEIRKEADALLWVARSALEKFDFEVIRVDQIARSTAITNEIVQLIQESELCLIVLTGENPNVFYELGRRHETGRPFIHLIRKGEPLPFDVAPIRTIFYEDIQSVASAAKVVEQLQSFIGEFEKAGYGASGTGVSLSTIAVALDRIERKVGQILGASSLQGSLLRQGPEGSTIDSWRNPKETYITAIAKGDLGKAATVLPRLEQLMGPSGELIAAAGILSAQGYEQALETIYRTVTEHFDVLRKEGWDILKASVASMVQFYVITDREAEGIARCESLILRVANLPDIDNAAKAYTLNQLQMLYYGAANYEQALSISEQVLKLSPGHPAYLYNLSLIYERLDLKNKMVETVDQYMRMKDIDEDHLSHAVEIYMDTDRVKDAMDAFAKLRDLAPDKAAVLLFRRQDVRQAFERR